MPTEKLHPHTGHRDRMRNRFYETGLDGFQPHEIIELLLFCCIPKRDVNPLAHALLEKFGSVDAVLSAKPEEIGQIAGAGLQTGCFFSALSALADAYLETRSLPPPRPLALADIFRLLTESERAPLKCSLIVVFTDRLNRPLSIQSFPGSADDPAVIRAVLAQSLRLHSYNSVIFRSGCRHAHLPSRREIDSFQPLIRALTGVNSFTVDCVLLTHDQLFSLRRQNLLTSNATELQGRFPRWECWLGPIASAESETGWYPISLIASPPDCRKPSSP